MSLEANWRGEKGLQQLFLDYPISLVLINPIVGECYFNYHYLAHFPESLLAEGGLRSYATSEANEPLRLNSLLQIGVGGEVPLTVYRITLQDFILLVITEGNTALPDKVLAELSGLAKISVIDASSGIGNRLPLLKNAHLEMTRSKRYQQPLALILLAFDDFDSTDEALVIRTLALLQVKLRNTDVLFRWDDNRFVVLTPACESAAAVALAEKLREVVMRQLSTHISLGVVEYCSGDDFTAWLKHGDIALIEAQRLGGNRSHVGSGMVADLWMADGSGSVNGLVWYKNYESGDSTIDAQHKLLFELANELIRMSSHNVNETVWKAKMDGMMEYVAKHFRDEEAILQVQGYKDLAEHKRVHASLLHDVTVLEGEVLAGVLPVNRLFEYVVNDVVAKHVLGIDRDYFSLFQHTNDQ